MASRTLRPVAFTPSSLVRRMRMRGGYGGEGGGLARRQPARRLGVHLPNAEEKVMQLPHNSFVVVADGKKMLFFRNEGDGDYPRLEVERKRETADAADRDQKTDA